VYRYRLLDEVTGTDLGPLISARLTFPAGETITRRSDECYEVINVVEPETETFRAYLIVRSIDLPLAE
jgi:hypothetical protein